ncbi:MAG TPA: serpin family protein, partial [Candidatus Tectomicrobia bacterium]
MRSSILLVLAGLSIMVASLGSPQAPAQAPLAPEHARTPMSLAVGMSNNFAMELYRRLAEEQTTDNLFFSPYSIVSAFAMAAEGARGETARQMGMVLRFPQEARRVGNDSSLLPWNTALLHTALADLQQRVLGAPADTAQTQAIRDSIARLEQEHQTLTQQFAQLSSPQQMASQEGREITQRDRVVVQELNTLRQQLDPYELRMVNALWGEHTFPLRQQFVDTVQSAYGAAAFSTDFQRFPEEARQRINHWVEQHTRERIRDLFPQGIISSDTRLVLANAVYFKGNWAEPFDK